MERSESRVRLIEERLRKVQLQKQMCRSLMKKTLFENRRANEEEVAACLLRDDRIVRRRWRLNVIEDELARLKPVEALLERDAVARCHETAGTSFVDDWRRRAPARKTKAPLQRCASRRQKQERRPATTADPHYRKLALSPPRGPPRKSLIEE